MPTALRLTSEVQYHRFPSLFFTFQIAYKTAICKPPL